MWIWTLKPCTARPRHKLRPPNNRFHTDPALRASGNALKANVAYRLKLAFRLEILKLITQVLSNREIGERLFLALDTVKGHNRRIFDKLQVQSRTEAIARAHELGLL